MDEFLESSTVIDIVSDDIEIVGDGIEIVGDGCSADENTNNTKGLNKKGKKGKSQKSASTGKGSSKKGKKKPVGKGKGKGKGKKGKKGNIGKKGKKLQEVAEPELTEHDLAIRQRDAMMDLDYAIAIKGIEKKMVIMAKMRDLCRTRLYKATNKPCMNVLLVIWKLFVMVNSLLLTYVGYELLYTFISFLLIGACINTKDKTFIEEVVRFDHFPKMAALSLHHPVQTTGRMIVASNIIYAASAFIFGTFGVHKFYCSYFIVNMAQSCCIFMEILINNIHLSDQSAANEENRRTNKEYLEHYKPNSIDGISLSYDLISLWGECCGIDDKNDFDNLGVNASLKNVDISFNPGDEFRSPLVCCDLDAENTHDVFGLKECARSIYPTHNRGCYTVLLKYLRNYSQFYTYVVIVVHLVDTTITFIVWILFLDKLKVYFIFLGKLEILFNKLQHQQWMKEEDMKKRVYRETMRQMEHARLKKQQQRRMPSAKQAVESLTKR